MSSISDFVSTMSVHRVSLSVCQSTVSAHISIVAASKFTVSNHFCNDATLKVFHEDNPAEDAGPQPWCNFDVNFVFCNIN